MKKSMILSMMLFYFIFIGFIIILINEFFDKRLNLNFSRSYFLIIIIFILFLLYLIIYSIVSLFKEFQLNKNFLNMRIKILFFFIFITFLSTIPHTIISITFINKSLQSWFSDKNKESLKYSFEFVSNYYNRLEKELYYLINNIHNHEINDIFLNIEEKYSKMNNIIDSIQIYSKNDDKIIFQGNKISYISNKSRIINMIDNTVIKNEKGNYILFMIKKDFKLNNANYYLILTLYIKKIIDQKAKRIFDSIKFLNDMDYIYKGVNNINLGYFYIIFFFPIILLSILLSFILSKLITEPIEKFSKALNIVAKGDFEYRIIRSNKSEFLKLIDSFNIMIDRINNSREKLNQIEKLKAWKDISRKLAHEIKNPLTPMKLATQRMIKKYETDNFKDIFDKNTKIIIKEVDYLTSLLNEFSEFAKIPKINNEDCNLVQIIKDIIYLYYNDINIIFNIEKEIIINSDPLHLKQIFLNLIKNGLESILESEDKNKYYLTINIIENSEFKQISINNNNAYLSKELINDIFIPYFTTKRSGTGLGLAIVSSLITALNGEIICCSSKNKGTTFLIKLNI